MPKTASEELRPAAHGGRAKYVGAIAAWCVLLCAATIVTRWPAMPRYLFSFDSVNFALALEHFDARLHQPQPPGYPLFVAEARLIHLVTGSPERTFAICKLVAVLAAIAFVFLLGRRLASTRAGLASAAFLFFCPVFWHASVASAIRPYLSVFASLVALLCYRSFTHPRSIYLAAAVLGIGAGWRPTLLVLLLPLLAVTAWQVLRSTRRLLIVLAVVSAATLVWLVPLLILSGGVGDFVRLLANYQQEQFNDTSLLYGATSWQWIAALVRLTVWLGIAMLACLPAVGTVLVFRWRFGHWEHPSLRPYLFLALWILPPVAFLAVFHAAHPGHTLQVVPALCLAAGLLADRASRMFPPAHRVPALVCMVTPGVAIGCLLFVFPYRTPGIRPAEPGIPAIVEQLRYRAATAIYEASYVHIRNEDVLTSRRLAMLRALDADNGAVIVWQDDDVSWRKIAYYYPTTSVLVVERGGAASARDVRLWRGNHATAFKQRPVPVSLRPDSRIIWMLHPDSPLRDDLSRNAVPLNSAGRLAWTDAADAPQAVRVGPFLLQKNQLEISN